MIAFLSPAKNMLEAAVLAEGHPYSRRITQTMAQIPSEMLTTPQFLEEALSLAQELKTFSPWQLESILEVNPELALKAFDMLQRFDPRTGELPALLAYYGLQYQHIAAWEFCSEDFASAQKRLRIVSGLYGVLRPLDLVMAYRLEMQCRQPFYGKRLYKYWGAALCEDLFSNDNTLINLASKEYAKAILPYAGTRRIVTCEFLIEKPTVKGGRVLRSIPTAAKMARGEMALFITKKRLNHPEQLQEFNWQGFCFVSRLSSSDHYVFARADLPFEES